MIIVLNTLAVAENSKVIQLIILNLVIFIEFVLILKTDPFNVSRLENRMRVFNHYVITLCFLNLFMYVGRYIDDEESIDGI